LYERNKERRARNQREIEANRRMRGFYRSPSRDPPPRRPFFPPPSKSIDARAKSLQPSATHRGTSPMPGTSGLSRQLFINRPPVRPPPPTLPLQQLQQQQQPPPQVPQPGTSRQDPIAMAQNAWKGIDIFICF
jgi:hypothetical protein